MILAAYVASCLMLAFAFVRLGVLPRTKAMLSSLSGAMIIVRDPAMDDLAKERTVQKASVDLLRQVVVVTAFLALAFGVAAIPAVAGATASAFTLEQFAIFSLRPDVLTATVAAFAGATFALRRLRTVN